MGNSLNILSLPRTLCAAREASKKRVFESAARLVAEDQSYLDSAELFAALINREKLGSTAMGNGIAIPHCRISNCSEPIGALLTLVDPIEFDAYDQQLVDIIFVLIVPEEAHQEHLNVLANLARMFSDPDNANRLRQATSDVELYTYAEEIFNSLARREN